MNETIVFFPARKGSQGLPGKNNLTIDGLSLLGWSVECVRASVFDKARFFVSTDDDSILTEARKLSLDSDYVRPNELATNEASMLDVVEHGLSWLKSEHDFSPKSVLLLQLTSPLRPPSLLDQAYKTFSSGSVPAVVGVRSIYRNLSTLFHANKVGVLTPLKQNDDTNLQRQQVKPVLTPNGALYLIRVEELVRNRTFLPAGAMGIEMDPVASLDIDSELDYKMCVALHDAGLSWRAS